MSPRDTKSTQMGLCQNITAKALVWLAAILVPVDALPLVACDCGNGSPQSAALKSARTDASPATKCPHCAARSRAEHSCCGTAEYSAQHKCCCCGNGPCHCCCKGKMGSHGGPCQCAANKPAQEPASLPSNSRTENTKSSLGSSSDTVVTVVAVPSVVLALAAQQPSRSASTSLERLSTLCRLVV